MVTIRVFDQADYGAVQATYRQGIETGNATFETEAKGWEEWNRSMLPTCRLVGVDEGRVIGWAALSPVSIRRVYACVAEVSVYVAGDARGRGIGHALLCELVAASEKAGLWTLQVGVFPENASNLALHRKNGFRVVGTREKLGMMHGRWRDVLLLERRSTVVGV